MSFFDDLIWGGTVMPATPPVSKGPSPQQDSKEVQAYLNELVRTIYNDCQNKRYMEVEQNISILASAYGVELPKAPLAPPPKIKLLRVWSDLKGTIEPLKDRARALRKEGPEIVKQDATCQTFCAKVTPILVDYNNQVAQYNKVIEKVNSLKRFIKDFDIAPLSAEEIKKYAILTGEESQEIVKKTKLQAEKLSKRKSKLEEFLKELKPFENVVQEQDKQINYLIQAYQRKGQYTTEFRFKTGAYLNSNTSDLPKIPELTKRSTLLP